MNTKQIVLTVSIVLFSIILLQNSDPTYLELFFWHIEMPLFILILATVILGFGVGWLAHLAHRKKKTAARPAPAAPENPSSESPPKPDANV